MGSFGAVAVAVPRARLDTADGRTTEWVNKMGCTSVGQLTRDNLRFR